MPEQKTKPTSADAAQFVNSITDSNKRNDALVLLNLFKKSHKDATRTLEQQYDRFRRTPL